MGEWYSAKNPGVRLKAIACLKERQRNPTLPGKKKKKKVYIFIKREPSRSQKAT